MKKFSPCQVLFFSDRSLRLRFLSRRRSRFLSVFCSLCLSLSISLCLLCLREKESGSSRSHVHLPPCFFFWFCFPFSFCFLCRGFSFWSRPFRRASFWFWRFVQGAFFVPVRFWDSLGARALVCFRASDPPSWTLGGGGVWCFSFLFCFCFSLCVWCLRLHTFSGRTGPWSHGTRQVVLPTPWEE